MKKLNTLPALGALTSLTLLTLLLLACFLASCDDGYQPSGPNISIDNKTLDLDKMEDGITITVSIPSKLMDDLYGSTWYYSITWGGDDIDKVIVQTDPEPKPKPKPDEDEDEETDPDPDPGQITIDTSKPYIISQRITTFSVTPKDADNLSEGDTFTISITVDKLIDDEETGDKIADPSFHPVESGDIIITVIKKGTNGNDD